MKREKSQISCEDQLNYFLFFIFAFCFLLFLSLFLGRGKTYATACDLFLITMQAVTSGVVTVLICISWVSICYVSWGGGGQQQQAAAMDSG